MDIKSDMQKSVRAFNKFTVHALKQIFGGDMMIIPTENHDSKIEKVLDCSACVDGLIVTSDGAIYPYASRVQFGQNYNDFTLRGERPNGTKTELEKLQQARKKDSLMPKFHIQTFVNADEQSATVGVTYTGELLNYCDKFNPATAFNHSDGVKFCFVGFDSVDRKKVFRVDCFGFVEDLTADFAAA